MKIPRDFFQWKKFFLFPEDILKPREGEKGRKKTIKAIVTILLSIAIAGRPNRVVALSSVDFTS